MGGLCLCRVVMPRLDAVAEVAYNMRRHDAGCAAVTSYNK